MNQPFLRLGSDKQIRVVLQFIHSHVTVITLSIHAQVNLREVGPLL
jgi:hypothetical protein